MAVNEEIAAAIAVATDPERNAEHARTIPTEVKEGLGFPKGLLLDFGGVVVQDVKRQGWEERVTDLIEDLFATENIAGILNRKQIRSDVYAAETAVKLLHDAQSRQAFPKEVTNTEYVLDYLATDWPHAAREVVRKYASVIAYASSDEQSVRVPRPGIAQLLEFCQERGIPVGIVSNAVSGQVHRDVLKRYQLLKFITAEIYSDEYAIRKPNPELIWLGADAIDVPVAECWYVGDHVDRDVLCGKRARVGASVLMPAPGGAIRPYQVLATPDVTVADPQALLAVLQEMDS
ncbi:MAG: HAD-IA family hydrolase [Actinomycetaceae bacterium]|nr:HAD-IA family hydrolase [Actinomycetaceae bacterium]